MTTFDERERGFETKFAHDEELAFKALSRRNKALALWAGGILGKHGTELDDYVAEVMRADLQQTGDEDVFRKVSADLGGRETAEAVRAKMAALLETAQRQIAAGD